MNPKIKKYRVVDSIPQVFQDQLLADDRAAWEKANPGRDPNQYGGYCNTGGIWPSTYHEMLGIYVQSLIDAGWQPYGFPMHFKDTQIPVQAMVIYEEGA